MHTPTQEELQTRSSRTAFFLILSRGELIRHLMFCLTSLFSHRVPPISLPSILQGILLNLSLTLNNAV